MALSAERVEGPAQLRRSLRVCFDRGRGEILPADRVVPLFGIAKEIRAPSDGFVFMASDFVRLSDDSE